MQMVDMTIVNIALPSLGSGLHASSGEQLLVLSAYTLAFACFLLTASRLGERWGRRRLFIGALAGFTVVSVLCGTATGAAELIVLRAVQGAYAALASAQTIAIISSSFPKSRHPAVFGIYGATAGVAAMLGPTLGGLLISADVWGLGWRMIFLVNLPLGLIACVVGHRCLPALHAITRPGLDLPGVALSTTGLFLLVLPLATGRERGWPTWQLWMLVGSVVVLCLFIVHQHRLGRRGGYPLLDLQLFTVRSFAVGSVLSLLFFGVFAAFFFTVSVTAQFGLGFSPLRTGLLTLPFAIGAAVGSVVSALLVRRIGALTLTTGAVLFSGSLVYTAAIIDPAAGIEVSSIILPLAVGGVAMGLFVAPLQATMLSGTSERTVGSASGTIPTVQQIGASVGMAVISLLFFAAVVAQSEEAVQEAQTSLSHSLGTSEVAPLARPFVVHEFGRCATAQLGSAHPDAPGPGCPGADDAIQPYADGPRSAVATQAEPDVSAAARQAASHTFLAAFTAVLWTLAAISAALAGLTLALRNPGRRQIDCRSAAQSAPDAGYRVRAALIIGQDL